MSEQLSLHKMLFINKIPTFDCSCDPEHNWCFCECSVSVSWSSHRRNVGEHHWDYDPLSCEFSLFFAKCWHSSQLPKLQYQLGREGKYPVQKHILCFNPISYLTIFFVMFSNLQCSHLNWVFTWPVLSWVDSGGPFSCGMKPLFLSSFFFTAVGRVSWGSFCPKAWSH